MGFPCPKEKKNSHAKTWLAIKKEKLPGTRRESFFIGLSDILQALAFAEDEEKIPEIPQEWWEEIGKLYSA